MATLHVKSSATGGGDGSEGDPYTFSELFANMTEGDEGYVWDDGDYELDEELTVDGGSYGNHARVIGVSSSGVIDGSRPTIRPSNSFSGGGYLLNLTSTTRVVTLENLIFSGEAPDSSQPSLTALFNWWGQGHIIHCRFTKSSAIGARMQSGGSTALGVTSYSIARSEFDWNGSHGLDMLNSDWTLWYCVAHDNSGDGIGGERLEGITSCMAYNNTGFGIGGDVYCNNVVGCTSVNNGQEGFKNIRLDVSNSARAVNNSASGNGTYGFTWTYEDAVPPSFVGWNHTHNNTSGATSRSGGMPGDNNVTGDPLFADAANGDFTPGDGSPLINAALGFGSLDIGAVQSGGGGGGGGTSVRLTPGIWNHNG